MTTGGATASDATLVAAVREGDREAFAEVYDRYADRLYDFAHSMLRHREDAADVVADSFVTMAEKLGQLRDPDRLRPWLYAITRRHCLARIKQRDRQAYRAEERLSAMAEEYVDPGRRTEQEELRTLVWDAAAGLAERDRALLDLHLRHGLEGAELAEAMGVSANNAYVMLNRLRAQVERSLGALLVARLGRDDCPELAGMLTGWDGSFSPLIRKRVARHVDGCDHCADRRSRVASPWALLSGVPLLAAPAGLRDRVLDDPRLVAHLTGAAPVRRPNLRTGLAVAAIAALLVILAVVMQREVVTPAADRPGPPTVVPGATVTPEPGAPTPTPAPEPTPTPTAPPPPPPTTPTPPEEPTREPVVQPPQIHSVIPEVVRCRIVVSATIDSDSPVTVATLAWDGGGASGSTTMTFDGDRWHGATDSIPHQGAVTLSIIAEDEAHGMGIWTEATEVDACPS